MVEYLEISGNKYPVRIGYYVMKNVKAETGMTLSQALEHSRKEEDFGIHEVILYYALRMGAFVEKVDMPFKQEDMEMILDLCFYDYMALYSSNKFFPKEQIKELEEEAEKKGGKQKPNQRKKT